MSLKQAGKSNTDNFYSPVFGETREATDKEREGIVKIIGETPVAVFQELNKALNIRGYSLSLNKERIN